MTIKVYNTLTRTKEPFEPIHPPKVGMYLCGPTVYKPAHIGHLVGPVIFDTVKRYLTYSGYDVTYIINITDVDDKLINKAEKEGITVEALAKKMTEDYFECLELFGVDTVDRFPYATEHIRDMLAMIEKLVADGYAYPLDGDVYFETTKDEKYGALSGRKLDEIMAGTRVEANENKHHPADFALWKRSKPGEPAWDSPWGKGRPGWHIECSAMSMKYLGETLDIHGGGLDLMFPHHENELAQSECCTGKTFAKYWMHNGLMQAGGEAGKLGGAHDRSGDLNVAKEEQEAGKLAGSKGADSVKLLFETFAPETIRIFLLATHYRSPIDFSEERIAEIEKSIEGFYRLFETFARITGKSFYDLETAPTREDSVSLEEAESDLLKEVALFRSRFWDAMDDDFNTGGAVGILHEMRRSINAFISSEKLGDNSDDTEAVITLTTAVGILKELASLLGVFRKPLAKTGGADDEFANGLMNLIIDLRAEARETKNWAIADRIRDGLKELNVVLEDRTGDTLWRRE